MSDQSPGTSSDQESLAVQGKATNLKTPTLLVALIFYVILFGMCLAGLAIALLLASRQ